jgi:hypothetical protein
MQARLEAEGSATGDLNETVSLLLQLPKAMERKLHSAVISFDLAGRVIELAHDDCVG